MIINNCILIGLGRISNKHIASIIKLGVKNLTVIEPNKDKHSQALVKYKDLINLEIHTDISNITKDSHFSLGIIATPSGNHFESFLRIAELTNNIIIEKPVALSLDDIDVIIENSRKKANMF